MKWYILPKIRRTLNGLFTVGVRTASDRGKERSNEKSRRRHKQLLDDFEETREY